MLLARPGTPSRLCQGHQHLSEKCVTSYKMRSWKLHLEAVFHFYVCLQSDFVPQFDPLE